MTLVSDELARRRTMSLDAALGLEGLHDPEAALSCHCACHSRRFGQTDERLHGVGPDCPCQQTSEERKAALQDWFATIDAYWASEQGRAARARQEEERAAALALAADMGLEVEVESEMVPLVLTGRRGDTGFWFRERHGTWRLHLDDMDGPVSRLLRTVRSPAAPARLLTRRTGARGSPTPRHAGPTRPRPPTRRRCVVLCEHAAIDGRRNACRRCS